MNAWGSSKDFGRRVLRFLARHGKAPATPIAPFTGKCDPSPVGLIIYMSTLPINLAKVRAHPP